jgi:hypothetical protein
VGSVQPLDLRHRDAQESRSGPQRPDPADGVDAVFGSAHPVRTWPQPPQDVLKLRQQRRLVVGIRRHQSAAQSHLQLSDNRATS